MEERKSKYVKTVLKDLKFGHKKSPCKRALIIKLRAIL